MKPKLFIGSAIESLDVAYAIQELLEHDVEPTVWTQGIFDISKYTLDSLIDASASFDFAVFVFTPDDVSKIRKDEVKTARDNVIFELGLFVGVLGRESCFLVVPRNVEDFHLPTDLIGLTQANYDADRQDGNLTAALGPAANRMRTVIRRLGVREASPPVAEPTIAEDVERAKITDPNDILVIIQSWMGSRPSSENTDAIRFSDVDRELGLAAGSAKRYIKSVAAKWDYIVENEGPEFILFKEQRRVVRSKFRDF